MRVLMLSRHAAPGARAWDVAASLAAAGTDVRLLAGARAGEVLDETVDGVRVSRVAEPPPMIPGWDEIAASLQDAMMLFERGIAALLEELAEVIVASGWAVASAAIGLRRSFETPLVALVEPRRIARRRRRWSRGDLLVEETERWLASEAVRVVVRSPASREVLTGLGVPAERVRMIRGVDGARLATVCSEAVEAPITIGDARRALAR